MVFGLISEHTVGIEFRRQVRDIDESYTPRHRVAPRQSWTDSVFNVVVSIGALNTIWMEALSATSRFLGGGLVRTTRGGRRVATTFVARMTSPNVPRTSTISVSPKDAEIATGSKPPFTTATATDWTDPACWMVACEPFGTDSGAKEM